MLTNMEHISQDLYCMELLEWLIEQYPQKLMQSYDLAWLNEVTKEYKLLDLIGGVVIENPSSTLVLGRGRTL